MSCPLAAVLLAAGGSRRLGRPKQLVTISGETLLRRAVRAAVAASDGHAIVVLGAADEVLRPQAEVPGATVVHNARWAEGIATSIVAGVDAAGACGAGAVLLMLCDQPRVDEAALLRLRAAHARGAAPMTAAAYGDGVGVPAIFDAALFGELRGLRGDQGAKAILRRRLGEVTRVAMPEAAIDVDTQGDLDAISS